MTLDLDAYDAPIRITRNGIRVGDQAIPGILHHCVTVRHDADGLWGVDITLLTGTEPIADADAVQHHITARTRTITYPTGTCDP